jgi:hypothetical protein
MATVIEIEQIKEQGLAILDGQIMDAIGHQNTVGSRPAQQEIEDQVHNLMQRRADLFRWAARAAENSPQLDEALRRLQSATAEMDEAAGRMKASSGFPINATALLGAADKALAALRQA